jgi:hypothetical protein
MPDEPENTAIAVAAAVIAASQLWQGLMEVISDALTIVR